MQPLTDEKLYQLCKEYGQRARQWRQKFIGLLPEVNRRRLYAKKGFESIFVFAAKLAGLSQEQVRLALNLEKRFEDKPALKSLLVQGEVSLHKLERVAFIATFQNEEALAEKVKQLSKSALETLVRDERALEIKNSLNQPLFDLQGTPGRALNFELSQDLVEQLNELNAQGRDVNQLLLRLLGERRQKIEEKKEAMSAEATGTKSRYLSVELRNLLKEEYGEKCSIKTCLKPAVEIHHSQRFSLASTHDPKYLAPLCHEHHRIAHTVDLKVRKMTG